MMNTTYATTAAKSVFETSSRKLEQFLYVHDIHHQSFYKDLDNMTVWVYPDSEELRDVVDEYRRICVRRRERAAALA